MTERETIFAYIATIPVSQIYLSGETERISVDMKSSGEFLHGTFDLLYDYFLILEADRYVDSVDLSTKHCAFEWNDSVNSGICAVAGIDLSVDGKILLLLGIRGVLAGYAENLTIILHFFEMEDATLTYHIFSQSVVGSLEGVSDDSGSTEKEPSEIELLKQKLNDKLDKSGHTPNMYLGTDAEGNVVARAAPSGGGGGTTAYIIGEGLKLDETTQTLSVDTATQVQQDNTRPVTSAAVYVTVGNIEALLKTI